MVLTFLSSGRGAGHLARNKTPPPEESCRGALLADCNSDGSLFVQVGESCTPDQMRDGDTEILRSLDGLQGGGLPLRPKPTGRGVNKETRRDHQCAEHEAV